MPSYGRGLCSLLVSGFVLGALVATADARTPLEWARTRLSPTCEPPAVFYSGQHGAGNPPCCPTIENVCPGGVACPASGVCPGGSVQCVPAPVANRPNVILFISDDQGYCHYGNAVECRSAQSGTPIPVPNTPSLDVLSGYGTVFPVAHNTAPWCFPSLASLLTGRYQRSFHGEKKISQDVFSTIPSALRELAGAPGVPNDPFNQGNKIGGYCTMLAGKFIGALDRTSFDAIAKTGARSLGRNDCNAGGPGEPPVCGATVAKPYDPFGTGRQTNVFNFLDLLTYRLPGTSQYAMQHFFVWYAPRIPHEPLRAPAPVGDYLFGGATFPLGGVIDLGQWCNGGACPSFESSFDEGSFGTVRDYYGNVWWVDNNVTELRHFLAAETAPHCIGSDGRARFGVKTQADCQGVWSSITPDLERNTVFLYLSDNGWELPHSKHDFTENGFRTEVIVYDPRNLPTLPSWDPTQVTAPPPQKVAALAHSTDMLPTALGFALDTPGSQPCPVGPDNEACDGHDLRPFLATAQGGPAAPEALRHALCGHLTKRPTAPTRSRYLLTRAGSIGRCTKTANPACTTSAQCQPGEFCLGGHCASDVDQTSCGVSCPDGSVCLGGRCRMGPACIDDTDCTALVGPGYTCAAKADKWCANEPNVQCSSEADCPVCPLSNGNPIPCRRLCEARSLKLYVTPGAIASVQLSDLFLDPDEEGLHTGDPTALVTQMSNTSGPYGDAIRSMNCCVDDWWPDIVPSSGTLCTSGHSCPADLVCDK
jgi:hypothetical protein